MEVMLGRKADRVSGVEGGGMLAQAVRSEQQPEFESSRAARACGVPVSNVRACSIPGTTPQISATKESSQYNSTYSTMAAMAPAAAAWTRCRRLHSTASPVREAACPAGLRRVGDG